MSKDPFSKEAAEEFLSGAGVAAKWPTVGSVVEGTVLDFSMSQQTDYDSGEPLYWFGNKKVAESEATNLTRPVMQLVMHLQCEPTGETWEGLACTRVELPDDDGARTMYVKGGLQASLRDALRKSGSRLEIGAYIRTERIADGPKSNPKFAAPNRYSSAWTPAAKNPKAIEQFSEEAPTQGSSNPFS